jgi:signal peptidase II
MTQDSSTLAPNSSSDAPLEPSTATVSVPPSYLFLGAVATVALVADALTKWWAETTLSRLTRAEPSIVLIDDVLTFTLAYNKGGAFGMLAGEDGVWRRPFFLLVSAGASLFIISLYRKIHPKQWALRWGLPLVLGGALGNFADRLTKGKVVDFIDYRAGWVESMNEIIASVNSSWHVTSHWPTFNVADICICIGVGLMVVDMFTAGGKQAQSQKVQSTASNG